MKSTSQTSISSRFNRFVDGIPSGSYWNRIQELAHIGNHIRFGENIHGLELHHARALWRELDALTTREAPIIQGNSSESHAGPDTTNVSSTACHSRLYTSIPPFDRQFAAMFCSAWNRNGFEICTVNSLRECEIIRSWGIPGLVIEEVPRDASDLYGRPLVYIHDLLEIITRTSDGQRVVGIVNADIMPFRLQNWDAFSSSLKDGSFHCFKRAEIETLTNGKFHFQPVTYRHGYDLFIWKQGNINTCAGGELSFAFGVPWWDYWFPMERMLAGDAVVSHESCWILHRSHDVNFDVRLFVDKGNEFLRYIRQKCDITSCIPNNTDSCDTDQLCSFCTYCIAEIDAGFFRRAMAAQSAKPDGVSVVTACMNRNDNLRRAIESWLPFPEIQEIIVVDWSSSVRVEDTLFDINDPRIRILRIEGKKSWILTHAFNAGLKQARFASILKLDADVVLADGFFDKHSPTDELFFAGNWRTAKNDSEKRLNGSFFASTRLVHATGMYNEFITTYGWDDCDLYTRFEKIARREDFDIAHLNHCEQEASSRISNQASKLGLAPLEIVPEIETELEIRVNEYLAFFSPEWHCCSMLAHDKDNARALAYRFALINELSKDYSSLGLGFSRESLSDLSLDGLLVLFACRHNRYFWHSASAAEFYRKLSCVPWSPRDAKIISREFQDVFDAKESPLLQVPLALSTTCERLLFRSKIRITASDGNPCYSGLVPGTSPVAGLIPSYFEQIAVKAQGRRITSISTIYNSDLHIYQFIDDLELQTAFDNTLFILIICNTNQNEFLPLFAFCAKHPENTVLINLPYDPGLYESWNMAAAATTTEYLTNWNTDDRRSPEHIDTLIRILDERPDVELASSALYVSYEPNIRFQDAEQKELQSWFDGPDRLFTDRDLFQLNAWEEPDPAKQLVVSQNFAHCMPVWRRSLHDRFGYFDESDYGPSADWEFWLRCGRGGCRFFLHGRVLGVYYLSSSSYGRRPEALACEQRIFKMYLTNEIEGLLRNPKHSDRDNAHLKQ